MRASEWRVLALRPLDVGHDWMLASAISNNQNQKKDKSAAFTPHICPASICIIIVCTSWFVFKVIYCKEAHRTQTRLRTLHRPVRVAHTLTHNIHSATHKNTARLTTRDTHSRRPHTRLNHDRAPSTTIWPHRFARMHPSRFCTPHRRPGWACRGSHPAPCAWALPMRP
jgi:hypothetical protein